MVGKLTPNQLITSTTPPCSCKPSISVNTNQLLVTYPISATPVKWQLVNLQGKLIQAGNTQGTVQLRSESLPVHGLYLLKYETAGNSGVVKWNTAY